MLGLDGQLRLALFLRSAHVQPSLDSPRKEDPLSTYVLKLYVAGSNARTQRAISNLRRICDEELAGVYDLIVIDVLDHPQLAEDDKVLATPTLIKQLPPPLRRVIGDLSDKEKVLFGLEVRSPSDNPSPPTST